MLTVDINKISQNSLVIAILAIFATLISPFWFIYQFQPVLIQKYSLLHLIILSLGIGFPILLLNFLCIPNTYPDENNKIIKAAIKGMIGVSSCTAILVLYTPMMLTFFGHVPLKLATKVSAGVQILVIIAATLENYQLKRKLSDNN